MLLATTTASLDTTRQMAEGGRDLGFWYVAAIAWLPAAVLFGWLMRVNSLRIKDRDRMGDKLEALALDMRNVVIENGRVLFNLERTVTEAMQRRGKPIPRLGPEPTSRTGPPPKDAP